MTTSQNPSVGSFTLKQHLHQALTCAVECSQIMLGQHESSGFAQTSQFIHASSCAHTVMEAKGSLDKKENLFISSWIFTYNFMQIQLKTDSGF